MADPNHITITATVVDNDYPAEVEITYAVTTGKIPRAFALDITVDAGTIVDIGNFFVGECNDSNGYGIFPASFARVINADFNNWDDANYTPVADVNDLPGDTEGGIGTNGVTIEMGSLYAAPKGPPEPNGILCSIFVDTDCHVDLALNVGRAGIVMEDGNSPDTITLNECGVTVVCTVPDVVDDTNAIAQLAIIAANFTIGTITTGCSDTIADGNVISTDPAAGVATCGMAVNIVVSDGQPTVPNVLDMSEADAITAIDAVDYISAGTPTYECSDTIANGNVISTTPGAGTASCGTTVAIVVSTGPPTVPDVVDMNRTDANTAIVAAGLVVGVVDYATSGTVPRETVLSQDPNGGASVTCGSAVDYTASSGCMPKAHADYAEWLSVGEPNCWCAMFNCRQCHGDADGQSQGKSNYWVSTYDAEVFNAAKNKTLAEIIGQTITVNPGGAQEKVVELICADFDHKAQGKNEYRVSTYDAEIFNANKNQANLPDCNCP